MSNFFFLEHQPLVTSAFDLQVTSYLQEIAPDLCNRVELYDKRIPIFDEYNIEEEINSILSKR